METNIRIRVERRKIKNLNMYLRPPYEEVLVTAPVGMPEPLIRKFIKDKEPWIKRNIARLKGRENNSFEKPSTEIKKQCIERLQMLLPEMISLWQKRLNVSLYDFRLRVMKTCWGVCHCSKATITFNTLLGLKDEDCIEYIVVHELCHLIEPSHSKRFYALMDKYMPDWKQRNKKLNMT